MRRNKTPTQHPASCVALSEAQLPCMAPKTSQSSLKHTYCKSQEPCLTWEKGRESRPCPVHSSAWMILMGDGSGERTGPEKLVGFQRSPSPSSRTDHRDNARKQD